MRPMMRLRDEKVVVELHSIGERVVESARKTMRAAANRMVKRARLMAPFDDGELEEAIHIERDTGQRGRLELTIVAGGTVNGVNVDDYATEMHEGSYNLGPNSEAKQASNPDVVVGPKFLERAAEDEEAKLQPAVIEAIRRVVPK